MTCTAPEPLITAKATDVGDIAAVLAELTSSARPFTQADLDAILADPGVTLFVIRAEGRIVGMANIVVYRVPGGVRAFIDDVGVSSAHRSQGLGEALVRAAIAHAASLGADRIDLTSRPEREAANRLYQRIGFARRETNTYRLTLKVET